MEQKFIITIGRQYGSGGREIGKRLSQLFNIAYYDKELIKEASQESAGLLVKFRKVAEYFEKADEKAPGSLRHMLSMSWASLGSTFGSDGSLCNENIFKYQSDVIQRIAQEHSCVIVGRCADYILRDVPNCFNIFIHAPMQNRIERITRTEPIDVKEALEKAEKINKHRAAYYNFYTDKEWGDSASYHLSIDSSILGSEETAFFIKRFIELKLEQSK